jgi:hypothetical protein
MATSICLGAEKATFTASHKTSSKSFVSVNTPLSREDLPYLERDFYTALGGSNGGQGGVAIPLFTAPASPDKYRVERLTVEAGSIEFILGGVSLGTFGAGYIYEPQEVEAMHTFAPGATLIGVGRRANFYSSYTYQVCQYVTRYGHKVTDKAGQTEIFRSGALTAPAPYTSSCTNQCPPGQIRCNGCCIACSDISAQLRAIEARL